MTNYQGPPSDRFCDLVMKGGIASGVVYPEAIAELSQHYRFQSIGGTSAGAIAAAVTAAAEYQRRHTGSQAGFDLLKALPTKLGDTTPSGKSKLLSLFQPQPPLKRLFSVLIGALNSKSTSSRIGSIVWGFIWAYKPAILVAAVLALPIGVFGLSWLAAVLIFVIALLVAVGIWVYRDVTRGLPAHNLGLCTGLTEGAGDEALTPWLHQLIQTAAGRSTGDPPLTFGDLWSVRSSSEMPEDRAPARSIDLQMFSTNLSHGRPYIFPLVGSEHFYFTETDMRRCLPPDVVSWIIKRSPSIPSNREQHNTEEPLELPDAKDFPILLAARMSLSFPFLFTAIPLYAIEPDASGKKMFPRRCWFSDGGISSNFPIHLFDDLVPRWPTFGLTLEPKLEGQSPVSLPTTYHQGYEERWSVAPEKKDASTLGWFISAIVSTMQNWNDNSLTRMPGVRDRVARVRLEKHEGGMNLNMEAKHIRDVAKRGVDATNQILARFAHAPSTGSVAEGWDEHRFVRLHVLQKMLADRSPGITDSLSPTCQYATDFTSLFTKMMNAKDQQGNPLPPPGYEKPMTARQCHDLGVFVKRLEALAKEIGPLNDSITFSAIPTPELRVRPPL